MTREEAIKKINAIKKYLTAGNPIWDVKEIDEVLNMAIKALQDKIDVDLISRADAMGAVQDHFNAYGFKGYYDGQRMMDRINALPPAGLVWEKTSLIERKKEVEE